MWRTPSLTEKAGRPQYRVANSQTRPKWPCVHRPNTFLCLWQLCPSESWARRWRSGLACWDPGSAKCAGAWTASTAGVMALSESFFFEALVAGNQKASLASLFPYLHLFRHLEGSLSWVPPHILLTSWESVVMFLSIMAMCLLCFLFINQSDLGDINFIDLFNKYWAFGFTNFSVSFFLLPI